MKEECAINEGLHPNGTTVFPSGVGFKGIVIDPQQESRFTFVIKLGEITDFDKESHISFGCTEGVILSTLNNGRTGRDLFGLKVDNTKKILTVLRPITIEDKIEIDIGDYDSVMCFEMIYKPTLNETLVTINKVELPLPIVDPEKEIVNNIVNIAEFKMKTTIHDEIFLFCEGVELGGECSLLRLDGEYWEVENVNV